MKSFRSLLYVPASRPERIAKAQAAGASLVIVDLEDAVAPPGKAQARENVLAAVDGGALREGVPWALRINAGPDGPPGEDLALAARAKPAWVVLPKAEEPPAAALLARRVAEHGARVALMIETARGVARAEALAACDRGVGMLVLGSADLRVSLGAREDSERAWEREAMARLVVAARCAGALAIDSVWFRYQDDGGLRRHAEIARGLGFDGKTCIHPRQVPVIEEAFAWTAEERAWAQRVREAWAREDGAARGVIALDGEMIEALHAAHAERILES